MVQPGDLDLGWLWYTQKTSDCVALDPKAYPSVIYDGHPKPWPEWVCRGPNGGGHINASWPAIDVHVEGAPKSRFDVSWTCDFGLFLVAKRWLTQIEDLIDGESTFVGSLVVSGAKLDGWATIHGRLAPALSSSEGRHLSCPNCGNTATVIHGRSFFADPAAVGRPLIVNWNGIFVREDIVAARNVTTPIGAFKPSLVRYEARC